MVMVSVRQGNWWTSPATVFMNMPVIKRCRTFIVMYMLISTALRDRSSTTQAMTMMAENGCLGVIAVKVIGTIDNSHITQGMTMFIIQSKCPFALKSP